MSVLKKYLNTWLIRVWYYWQESGGFWKKVGYFQNANLRSAWKLCAWWKGKKNWADELPTREPNSGSKWLEPTKNKFNWFDLISFMKQFSAFWHNFPSCSFCFLPVKICQTVVNIRITSQCQEFLHLIFGWFLPFDTADGHT